MNCIVLSGMGVGSNWEDSYFCFFLLGPSFVIKNYFWNEKMQTGFETFSLQVIPGLLCQPADDGEKSPDLFAYISTEDVKKETSWAIRKCNLTKSRLSGGVVLAEVQLTSSSSNNFFCIFHMI